MCGHGSSPTPPSSEDGSCEESDAGEPRYTPEELGALFLDFYRFLTTLHYDENDLKVPPPGGWPQITPESCAHFKSDYAIESRLIDFTAFTPQDYEKHKSNYDGLEFWSDEGQVDPSDVVCIATGGESFARQLWLNVKDCQIHEDMVAGDMLDAAQVETFFENLKQQYRTLKLIPGRGRITIEAEKMPEREGRITEEELRGQTKEWGTELDMQYVRQIYRQHGWPDEFRKQEAFKTIDDWIDPLYETRYEWARSPPDWDSIRWT
ncbi:hypothetical protein FDECE_9067 [Fusarium decemcellulare]|nr:hypothetical protein FDECE_9067 [Fusarium decemcellulare]